MKVSRVTISHLIGQCEIESRLPRCGKSTGELDCRNTRRFLIDAFSMVVALQISVGILLLDLTEHPSLDTYAALRTNAFLRCKIIAPKFREKFYLHKP